jgi:hypothetical protein
MRTVRLAPVEGHLEGVLMREPFFRALMGNYGGSVRMHAECGCEENGDDDGMASAGDDGAGWRR